MADDVMTQNGTFDPVAQWARLSERVENQGKDIIDLRSNMNTGFNNIQASLSSLTNEFRSSGKTPWGVIFMAAGVVLSITAMVGSLTISPIRDAQSNLAAVLKDIRQDTVSREEMDIREQYRREAAARNAGDMIDLRKNSVGRAEWTERNRAVDQQLSDTSRRIDELRQDFGAVYGTRDVIKELQDTQDKLRDELARVRVQATQVGR